MFCLGSLFMKQTAYVAEGRNEEGRRATPTSISRPLDLKCWHFEATEDIMTKFKSQALHIIIIKYLNASGSGSPPSLIPTLWNIGILLHKQAKRRTIMHTTVSLGPSTCSTY